MKIYIMRGVSGAGKSTWIERNVPDALILSADHEHIDDSGVYRYDKKNAATAHRKTYARYLLLLAGTEETKKGVIVVDNTNIAVWEVAPYYRAAEALGYDVTIIEIKCDPEIAARRTKHGTPATTIGAMHNALMNERLPPWWKRHVYDQNYVLVYQTG